MHEARQVRNFEQAKGIVGVLGVSRGDGISGMGELASERQIDTWVGQMPLTLKLCCEP